MCAGTAAQLYVSVAKHSAGILLCTPPPVPVPAPLTAAASTALELLDDLFVSHISHVSCSAGSNPKNRFGNQYRINPIKYKIDPFS